MGDAVNKSLAVGLLVGAVTVTAGGALAGYRMMAAPAGAQVISATAVTKTVKTPRQDCHDEQVTHQKAPKDEHRLVGTGVGAVVGGLLGSRIGGGNTRIVTGLAGAAAGGYAGNKIQGKMQKGDTYTTTKTKCVAAGGGGRGPAGGGGGGGRGGGRRGGRGGRGPGRRRPGRGGRRV